MSKRGHVLLVTHAGMVAVMMLSGAANAVECLAQPNRTPTEGEHWYFRTNHQTDQKCWYLRPRDVETTGSTAATRQAPAPVGSEAPSKDSQLTVSQERELFNEFLQWRARRETR